MPIGPSGKIMKRDLLDAVDRGDLAVAPVRSTPVEQRSATSVGTDAAGEE
jgi:hypothetical protein